MGDIGGTNSRFGLICAGELRPRSVETAPDEAYPAFEDAVAAYLHKTSEKPRRAAFAVAGPVRNGAAHLTNRDWTIDAAALSRRFGFAAVKVINDFVAQAASLPHLAPDELRRIGGPEPRPEAVKAAVGPGTGLGVAALLRVGGTWLPVASEGGHVELAAVGEREDAAFAAIRREHGRVSAEHVLSGPGLARLHRALHGGAAISAAAVSEGAARNDPAALETIEIFLRILARFAGDVALTFGAGGVYFCGGVLPKLIGFVDTGAFRSSFEAKGPHRGMMRETATLLVTSPVAGLVGCAALAEARGR
ncbi:glucokinase [Hansschlegelia sp.]|uniref:glucokinase n=1 Tax=Hansschlegelia sp. TaxID=2041892 RepID=UPI002C1C1381|nr:glucokinase [Hansschlegelia sp.]HVI29763.1 glucokinase [Hansschlegelia sp.]